MGHFSYTCQLSGVTITDGDKAVILPIFPKKNWSYNNSQESLSKFGKSNLCSNDGANLYFDELTFPIFGKYDSYGRLEEIENDDNTKVLEEFFELPIDKICTVLTDDRKNEFEKNGQFCDSVKILNKDNEKHMMLLKTSVTWFRREVYDKLANHIIDDEYDSEIGLGTHGILIELGFSYIGLDKSEKRYNKVYEKDKLRIYSDGNYIKNSIYWLEDFKKYCSKYNVDIDIEKVKSNRFSQLYDFVLPYHNNIIDFSKERNLVSMLLGDEYKVSEASFNFYERLLNKGLISEEQKEEIQKKHEKLINKNLTLFYFKSIKKNKKDFLKKNIVDWHIFKSYYWSTGRFLYPIGTSAQDGEHHKVKILLESSLSVINKDLEKYDND